MAKVIIKGREYELRYDLDAMERIEEEFGSRKEATEAMKKSDIKSMKKMFVILANSARGYAGEPEDITEDVLKHAPLKTIEDISVAFVKAMEEGMKTETIDGGVSSDDIADLYTDEEDEKNA